MGTPAYMSPEQVEGHTEAVDARSDQFSFCVALYEGLFGVRPFADESMEALLRAVLRGEVRAEPEGAKVPSAIRALLRRGLRVDPEARYPSMDALIVDLDRALARGRRQRRALTTALLAGGESAPCTTCLKPDCPGRYPRLSRGIAPGHRG